jgi:hypothetical protein
MSTIEQALKGERGEDQRRIAMVGTAWLQMLLEKNADYGSSAWDAPELAPQLAPGDAILARMSDKVKRIRSLQTRPPEVTSETLADTIRDLGAYCLLWLSRPVEEMPPVPSGQPAIVAGLECFGPMEVYPVGTTNPEWAGRETRHIVIDGKRYGLPPALNAQEGDRVLVVRKPKT